jgi:hypothetical protein
LKKVDFGKLGRGYVAGLWLATGIVFFGAIVKWLLVPSTAPIRQDLLATCAAILSLVALFVIAAWGVIRRRTWSYYLSLVIAVYMVVDSIYTFRSVQLTAAPDWFPAIPLCANLFALGCLATAGMRSQFSLTLHRKKV